MAQVDLWYATRATGLVALLLLTATVVLGILVAGRARSALPAFARAEVHRNISLLTLGFLAAHILTSLLDSYVHIGWWAVLVPFASSYHPLWLALGTVAFDSLLALAVSSALRHRIPARAWRAVHWLGYLSWPAAVSHGLGIGTDAGFSWFQVPSGACVALVLGAVCWRLVAAATGKREVPVPIIGVRPSLRRGRAVRQMSQVTAAP